MKKWLYIGILILILISGYFLFGKKENLSTSETIKIGAVLSLSGAAAQDGENIQKGMELAKADLAGKGIDVEIFYQDDSGVEIISESFAANATDVRTQIVKLKSSNPDALFIIPQNESTSEVILTQMEQMGFKPKKILANDVLLNARQVIANHSGTLEGALGPNYIIQSDQFQKFLDLYTKKYDSEGAHINASVIAYDSMYLLADGIRSVGTDPDKLRDYLSKVNFKGMSGNISFNEKNDRNEADYVLSIINNGKLVPVK